MDFHDIYGSSKQKKFLQQQKIMFKNSIELLLNLKNDSQVLNPKEIKTASSTDNIQVSYGQYAKLLFISLGSRSLSTGG